MTHLQSRVGRFRCAIFDRFGERRLDVQTPGGDRLLNVSAHHLPDLLEALRVLDDRARAAGLTLETDRCASDSPVNDPDTE